MSAGLLGHTLLATFGLGAILRASEPLFIAFKLWGAAYLVYFGIGMLRDRETAFSVAALPQRAAALRACSRAGHVRAPVCSAGCTVAAASC